MQLPQRPGLRPQAAHQPAESSPNAGPKRKRRHSTVHTDAMHEIIGRRRWTSFSLACLVYD